MSDSGSDKQDGGIGEALRAAVERTLAATTQEATQTRERAGELVDEIARRGAEAREQLARRGQEAQAELAKRGQGARSELARQIEGLERRLAAIEELLRGREDPEPPKPQSKPKG